MSHIEVDLKVLEVHAPMVARASEQPVTHILGGLNLLWHRCWSTKTALISKVGLAGIFGPRHLDETVAAMVDVGFLEPLAEGWRVKGAEKYLRITEARSKGGKAASGNLKRGTKPGVASRGDDSRLPPGSSRDPAGEQPGDTRDEVPGSFPALTPNTEHRTPRGSMSSPLEQPRGAPAPEDENSRWGSEADDFVAWASSQAPQLSDPGEPVRAWARAFFAKYQPSDRELPRAAFAKFLLWCHTAGKTVGWGLWLSERVWEPRWAEVRAEAQRRRGAA